ncbi:hypothetical protein F4604DRAFT_1925617 [Suillus subluteus]|nr:hypothetical protein F4604DRAFT_1925617 [Suillus subluteus]
MPSNCWCSLQKKAKEDAGREAKFTAAIQAIKEKKTKNLQTAAAQFKKCQKRTKPYSRVLTSEEGCVELRELEADQAEHEHREEVSKQKKVAEEQGKCDRRAEQECSQAAYTGTIKTKKLEELRDIATAL